MIFDVDVIAFNFSGYPVSYLELVATLLGLLSVWFATRENILTWPVGLLNEIGFFYLFFQVSLYAGMLLQLAFFVVTLTGWYYWRYGKKVKDVQQLPVSICAAIFVVIFFFAFVFNLLIANLHLILPGLITSPAAQPFIDSWVAVASLFAVFLLARKYLFSWPLWIMVDLVSIYLFWNQQLYLVAIEYVIFLLMAIYGYWHWRKLVES